MRANQLANRSVQFRLLSQDQLEEIYRAALRLLEYTGLDVHNEEARVLLSEAGAWVDGVRVRLPSPMVVKALASAPRGFTVFSREGEPDKDLHIAPERFYYGPVPSCSSFMDPRTGAVRKYTRADARAVATVSNALPSIDFVESLGSVGDIPYELADTYEFAEMIAYTGKPIVAWSYAEAGCREIHQMAVAIMAAVLGTRNLDGLGSLSLDEVFSAEQAIFDCEIRDFVERFVAGVDVHFDPERLQAEVPEALGAGFLSMDSTLNTYRDVYWLPRLSERRSLAGWLAAGRPDPRNRAKARARDCIARHDYRLPDELQRELDAIYAEAEQDFLG